MITIILDNRTTGMTGHQDNPGTGHTLQMQDVPPLELDPLVRALGIEHVKTVPAFDVKALDETLKEFLKADGTSVLIARDECALLPSARKRWRRWRSSPKSATAAPCASASAARLSSRATSWMRRPNGPRP